MKQILTFALGQVSNTVATWFWMIQQYYQEKPETFFQPLYQDRIPRFLSIDKKQSLLFDIPQQIACLWQGKIQNLVQSNPNQGYGQFMKDLVIPKNVLRDPQPDQLEDRIRWLCQQSERTQGTQILLDWDFSDKALQTLQTLTDQYPKLPGILITTKPEYSELNSQFIYDLNQYSQLLHLPSISIQEPSASLVSTALQVLSYPYRTQTTLQETFHWFLQEPWGNTASIILQQRNLGPCGSLDEFKYRQVFERGLESQIFVYPENYPEMIQFPVQVDVMTSSAIGNYYSYFRYHDSEVENYFLSLIERYQYQQNY